MILHAFHSSCSASRNRGGLLRKKRTQGFIVAMVASAVLLLTVPPRALADPFPSGTYKINTNPIPWGGGCQPVSMVKGTLTASCLNYFQNEQHTVLMNADTCAAEHHDIKNVNGILRCVSSETPLNNIEHPYVANVVSLAADVISPEGETKTFVVDQPRVDVPDMSKFPMISMKPGDTVMIGAGGCVQTGGFGATWKSYTNPLGDNANKLYSGTVWIDGVTGGGPQKIGAVMNKPWKVPTPKDPKLAQQYFLQLGYLDDGYPDNGYYAHDNGNDNQCSGLGPAWVEIKVTSGPVENGVQLSPHSKPFDVVWDMNNDDFNGLPLNPKWTWQLTNPAPKVPDFLSTCGAAFPQQTVLGASWGGTSVNVNTLANQCTSQAPVVDMNITDLIDVGYCRGLVDGHVLWDIVTYTGQINYQDWSGNSTVDNFWLADGDYGMGLSRSDEAGQTTTESSLGLEFKDDETLRLAGGDWFKQLVNGIENGASPTPASMMGGADGLPGTVTAVIGIDGVHDHGYAELHPVFALALNTKETDEAGGSVQQDWVFFLRNSGNNGGCSQEISKWPSSLGNNEYFIQLQWPDGATGAKVVGQNQFFSWQDQKTIGAIKVSDEPGWTLIDVTFPPNGEFGVDGSFTVEYTFPAGHKRAAPRAGRPASEAPKEKEADTITIEQVVSKIKDPTLAAQFRTEAASLKPPASPLVAKRIPIAFDTSMQVMRKTPGAAKAGRLTRPELEPDTAKKNLNASRKAVLDKYVAK